MPQKYSKSKRLNFALILITLITKPKAWIVTGASMAVLSIMKFFFSGQAIFFDHWRDILSGMANPDVPIEQKVFILSLFVFITGMAMYFTSLFKQLAVHYSRRFMTDNRH